MFNKFFLPFCATVFATSLVAPSSFAVQKNQQVAAPVWLMGLTPSSSTVDRAKQDIKQVLNKNIRAINQGDSQGYLQTLSPTSPEYRKATQDPETIKLFKAFGLVASLQQLDYLKLSSRQATVKVKIAINITKTGLLPELAKQKKISVNALRKSQTSVGMIKLTKVNGKWLIASTAGVKPKSANRNNNQLATTQTFRRVFAKHLQALNRENLQAYLETLDRTSPNYEAAKVSTPKLFEEYDLKYELQSIEIISQGKQDAVVKMVATVRKIRGGAFTDSTMVTFNTLKKTGNQWQIYDTQMEQLTPLNPISPAKATPTKKIKIGRKPAPAANTFLYRTEAH